MEERIEHSKNNRFSSFWWCWIKNKHKKA